MQKRISYVLLIAILCSFFVLPHCSIIGPIINEKLNENQSVSKEQKFNEKITEDVTPPANYTPNFLSNSTSITSLSQSSSTAGNPNSIDVQLSRIDANDPNEIFLYIHFIDQNGNYISGAAAQELAKYWCGVEESWDTLTYEIEDFKVTEETASDSIPLAMCIAMDHSGSIGHPRALVIQDVVEDFIGQKRREDAVALIKFDHHVEMEAALTTNSTKVLSQFQKNGLFGYGGGTAILDGIDRSIDELVRSTDYNKRKHIIIFTDGFENASSVTMDYVIDKAINAGVHIHTIGFGIFIDVPFLQELASRTGGMYRQMYMTSEFGYVFTDSYFRQKNFYKLAYKPKNYGLLTITVKLCLPEGEKMVAAQVFYPPPKKNVPALINILFEFDKYKIPAQYIPEVDKVHNLMTQIYPQCKIELRGHTCDMGDEEYNQKLSENRANAVKTALIKRGIAEDRITVIGFGESQPVVPNNSEENRKINRRTEFIITDTGE